MKIINLPMNLLLLLVIGLLVASANFSQAQTNPGAAKVLNSEKVKFNPDAPIYIEYQTGQSKNSAAKVAGADQILPDDISVQIDDARSAAKVRLALQAKPESLGVYYGYMWLQLGKKITDEVYFKRFKNVNLKSWLTNQDGIQALFLFDSEEEAASFRQKASVSKKPLTDTKNLPQLINATGGGPSSNTAVRSKLIEVGSEMSEIAKYAQLIEAYNAFSPEQKKLNNEKAQQLSQSALKQYQQRNYTAAENQFSESLKLNPTSLINRYYLGVCNYQNKKYENSLALLSLAEGADYNYAEYNYYTGLNEMRLKQYEKSLEHLESAKDEQDPDYSGAAAFFMGHIYFQKEDYALARKQFEFTIDHSKNPKMDNEAEAMLSKIDSIENYQQQLKERFKYTLFAGIGYDSNVMNSSTENLTTSMAAYRAMYGAQLSYKFFINPTHDMNVDLGASDFYSLNDKFRSDSDVQSYDPQQFSAGLPYHRRFQIGERVFNWGFLPSYQQLNMSLTENKRSEVLGSTIIGTDLQFAVTDKYFSKIYLEQSIEKSKIEFTDAADDLSATKSSLLTTQTWIVDMAQKKIWAFDLGYAMNQANGDNNDYTKIALGISYSQLAFWNAIHSARLDFTSSKYQNSNTDRSDSVGSLTLGLTKELTKKVSLGISGLYSSSQSNVDTYKYNKFSLQTLLNYSGGF